jgi:quinol-cytochrome oxidoreductase complex cytochrome b subunit
MSTSRRIIAWFEERLNLTEIFSFFTTFGLSYGPLDLNKPVAEASKDAFGQELQAYTRGPYVLGVLTFVLFVFQGVTGLLLAFYYQPSTQTAYETTLLIIREANFGWYIHQMHHWGSNFLIALLALRLVRFFVHAVYKSPRELFWVVGVLLLILAAFEALLGTLLPWDQRAYWSVTRGLEVIGSIPVVGSAFSFVMGGLEVSSAVLTRFYVLHITVIPVLMFFFYYLHFATVRKVGLSPPQADQKPQTRRVFPDHVFQLAMLFLLVFAVILTLGAIFPRPFWAKADPFTSLPGAKPPWYLASAYSLTELLPRWFAGLVTLAAGLALIFLPFLEKSPSRKLRERPVAAGAAALIGLVVIILTVVGYLRG